MNQALAQVLDKVASTADFAGVDFANVNAINAFGDNALHCVCTWGDESAARLLIDAGVDTNAFGELGRTPLHESCAFGHLGLVKLLVENGANPFSQAEGDLPFTSARLSGHNEICEYLSPLMKAANEHDVTQHIRSRIAQLQREIQRLERSLATE